MKENYIELGTVSKFTCAVSDPLIFSLIEIVGSILSLVSLQMKLDDLFNLPKDALTKNWKK